MNKTEQRKVERIDRLSTSANLAAKLRPIIDDPDITRHLDGIESRIVEEMIRAKTSEDRDRHAAEIKAWRAMRAELRRLAFGGQYAERKLEEITKDTETHA